MENVKCERRAAEKMELEIPSLLVNGSPEIRAEC